MNALTIYNHGTDTDQSNDDNLITLLHNTTAGIVNADWAMVTNGVGSRLKVRQASGLKKVKEAVGGGLFGAGIDDNVVEAAEWAEDRLMSHQGNVDVINMCGYSRGGVTCFKIANYLWRKGSPAIRHIPVRIFAIDPVPGCCTFINSHMYKHIELTHNVKECKVILAENERRKTFRPVLDVKFFDNSHPETYLWDTMPGNHIGIVQRTATAGDSERLVHDMAKRFLRKPHHSLGLGAGDATVFMDGRCMTKGEILGRYSTIMVEYRKYAKSGQGTVNAMMGGFGSPTDTSGGFGGLARDRNVRVKTESNSLRANHNYHGTGPVLKAKNVGAATAFFINNDHKTRFEAMLPATYQTLLMAERGSPQHLGNLVSQTSVPGKELMAFFYGGGNAHVAPVEDHIRGYLDMYGLRPEW